MIRQKKSLYLAFFFFLFSAICVCMNSIAKADGYNAAAAVKYAVNNVRTNPVWSDVYGWTDPSNTVDYESGRIATSKWCAEYVSDCLHAGGFEVPNSICVYNPVLKDWRNPYINSPALYYWFKENNYTIVSNPSQNQYSLGDIAFMDGKDYAVIGHVVIITGFTSSGTPLFSGHNAHRLNRPVGTVHYLVKINPSSGSGYNPYTDCDEWHNIISSDGEMTLRSSPNGSKIGTAYVANNPFHITQKTNYTAGGTHWGKTIVNGVEGWIGIGGSYTEITSGSSSSSSWSCEEYYSINTSKIALYNSPTDRLPSGRYVYPSNYPIKVTQRMTTSNGKNWGYTTEGGAGWFDLDGSFVQQTTAPTPAPVTTPPPSTSYNDCDEYHNIISSDGQLTLRQTPNGSSLNKYAYTSDNPIHVTRKSSSTYAGVYWGYVKVASGEGWVALGSSYTSLATTPGTDYSDCDEYYNVISSDGLNVRGTPNGSYIGTARYGTRVHITKKTNYTVAGYTWGFGSTSDNVVGWMVISNSSWATRDTGSTSSDTTDCDEHYNVVASDGFLSVRQTPNGTKLGEAQTGTQIHITKKTNYLAGGYTWGYGTTSSGLAGWMVISNSSWAVRSTGSSSDYYDCDEYYRVVSSDGFLSVRSTPNGSKVGEARTGTEIHITRIATNVSSSYTWGYGTTSDGLAGWMAISNTAWTVKVEKIPSAPWASVSSDSINHAETVDISWGANNAASYYLHVIIDNGDQGFDVGTSTSTTLRFTCGNQYTARIYITATNVGGSVDSDSVYVTVKPKPTKPVVAVEAGNNTTETRLSWSATDHTTHYDIKVYDASGQNIWDQAYYDQTTITLLLPAGSYQADVASVFGNNGSYTFSDRVSFTVASDGSFDTGTCVTQKVWNHKLYKVYASDSSWLAAKELASQSGGNLVTITSAEEQQIVATLAKSANINCWIGAENYTDHGSMRWVTGESFSYSNWDEGEPNHSSGENCAHIYANSGTWNDLVNSSDTAKGYIAEYPAVSLDVKARNALWTGEGATVKENIIATVTFVDGTAMDVYDFTIDEIAGTSEKTVTVGYGDLTANCTVTFGIAVTGITIDKTETIISVGKPEKLVAQLEPSNASIKDVYWMSSDETIAIVSSDGTVTGLKSGEAVITAFSDDPNSEAQANCIVTVITPVSLEASIEQTAWPVNMTAKHLNMISKMLTVTATYDDGTSEAVDYQWKDDYSPYGIVSGTIERKVGPYTFIVTYGDLEAELILTLVQPVTDVTLDKTSATIEKGKTLTLTATVAPTYASDKGVTWSSSDTNVATVSETGVVTAMANGTATITVTTKDNSKTAICVVNVVSPEMSDSDFVLPNSLKEIEEEAFAGLPITVVKCPESLMTIKEKAFANCASLIQIYIPESCKSISKTAFEGCNANLTIFGKSDSVAEMYAALYGYDFVPVM